MRSPTNEELSAKTSTGRPRIAPDLQPLAVPIGALKEDPENARRHGSRNMAAISWSLDYYGQQKQIVYRQVGRHRIVVAGNGTLAAAKELGWSWIAAARFSGGDKQDAEEYAVVDNQSATLATWDHDNLSSVLEQAHERGIGLDDMGFSKAELARFLPTEPVGTIPQTSDGEPITEPPEYGDVIELGDGRHLLICGDSTDPELWAKARQWAGEDFDVCWTDPPYGVGYTGVSKPRQEIAADKDPDSAIPIMRTVLQHALGNCKAGAPFYVAASSQVWQTHKLLADLGVFRQTLQWVKDSIVPGRQHYNYQNEPVYYGWKPGAGCFFTADRTQSTVLNFARPRNSKIHPTQKPVSLIERCLLNSSTEHQIVVDPFGGSGSTLIACARLNRRSVTIELNPHYCAAIVDRYNEWADEFQALTE